MSSSDSAYSGDLESPNPFRRTGSASGASFSGPDPFYAGAEPVAVFRGDEVRHENAADSDDDFVLVDASMCAVEPIKPAPGLWGSLTYTLTKAAAKARGAASSIAVAGSALASAASATGAALTSAASVTGTTLAAAGTGALAGVDAVSGAALRLGCYARALKDGDFTLVGANEDATRDYFLSLYQLGGTDAVREYIASRRRAVDMAERSAQRTEIAQESFESMRRAIDELESQWGAAVYFVDALATNTSR